MSGHASETTRIAMIRDDGDRERGNVGWLSACCHESGIEASLQKYLKHMQHRVITTNFVALGQKIAFVRYFLMPLAATDEKKAL
jgi:hypothetical protein